MKTKLLRKVRKRYSIVYEEKSTYFQDVISGFWNFMYLQDNTNTYRRSLVFVGTKPNTKDEIVPSKKEATNTYIKYW